MSVIGYDNSNKEILEYKFNNKDFFYSWLDGLKLKIKKGFIFKGSSEIGVYKFEKG